MKAPILYKQVSVSLPRPSILGSYGFPFRTYISGPRPLYILLMQAVEEVTLRDILVEALEREIAPMPFEERKQGEWPMSAYIAAFNSGIRWRRVITGLLDALDKQRLNQRPE